MKKIELSDEERLSRVEDGARTLDEIDPVLARRIKGQARRPAITAAVVALILLGYTVAVLTAYERLFRVEETAPAVAAPALEQVSPGPVITCPPDPAGLPPAAPTGPETP